MKKFLAIAGLALWLVGSGWYYTCKIKEQCYNGSPPPGPVAGKTEQPGTHDENAAGKNDSVRQAIPEQPAGRMIYFLSNSAAMKADPAVSQYLAELASYLKDQDKMVELIGHTDNIGSEEVNKKMGELRAGTVRSALLDLGAPPGKIKVTSMGESKPVASNDTEEGRAQNRRTEIVIK